MWAISWGRGMLLRYLCKHHSIWYAQENRPAPPFLCTYMGRQDDVWWGGRHFSEKPGFFRFNFNLKMEPPIL
jgi:hypothetical protein